ncbi:hypothetical protein VPH35_125796 [Triticum aestivum]|uniref:F-box/LRR-repeat protein At2g43260 n=1 Tax=Triticum aestivum TaxID=4565 RepID=UPI0008452E14|nr:F-box/LRR-repeat protein At2g43260-like [Triticum aestivum]
MTTTAAFVSPPTDVIFEILSWLPAKSLRRCRCVSKKWRDLISDPAFVAAHRSRAKPEPLLVAMTHNSHAGYKLQLMDTEGTVVRVVSLAGQSTFRASHDGLVCITLGYNNSRTQIEIVDLATEVRLMNLLKPAVGEYYTYYTCIGFGRTAQSGAYKVLLLGTRTTKTQTWEVLTVGDSAEWRQTQPCPMMVRLHYDSSSGVTVNGASHFLSHDENYVLHFDLESEEWKVIHGPQGAIRDQNTRSIAELNATLCMAQILSPVIINVWLLTDSNKNNWVKTYTIPTDWKVVNYVVPLRELHLGELLFYYYGNSSKPNLQVYDPVSGRCTDVKTPTNIVGKIGLCSSNLNPSYSMGSLAESP